MPLLVREKPPSGASLPKGDASLCQKYIQSMGFSPWVSAHEEGELHPALRRRTGIPASDSGLAALSPETPRLESGTSHSEMVSLPEGGAGSCCLFGSIFNWDLVSLKESSPYFPSSVVPHVVAAQFTKNSVAQIQGIIL